MRAAFKPDDTTDSLNLFELTFDEGEGPTEQWVDLDSFFDEPHEIEEHEVLEESEIGPGVSLNVNDWQKSELQKLPCFSHLYQLIIKDAVKKSPAVLNLVNDIKAVKAYLHRSPPAFDSFKSLAGKGLVNQADTRWNTLYDVLERLTQVDEREFIHFILEFYLIVYL